MPWLCGFTSDFALDDVAYYTAPNREDSNEISHDPKVLRLISIIFFVVRGDQWARDLSDPLCERFFVHRQLDVHILIPNTLNEGQSRSGNSVEHVHCPEHTTVFFLFDGAELVTWLGEETNCFGEPDSDAETYEGTVGTAGMDIDENAEDNGLEEGEGDDAFSDEGSDYLVCGC